MAIATRCPILHFQVNPYHVFGVDAVKGPCAVFIFLFFFVACYLCVCWLGFGGGGWGGMLTFIATATTQYVLLHFHTYVMLRCWTALPHRRHATLLHVLLHFHTYVMLRCCTALPHRRHATLLHVL